MEPLDLKYGSLLAADFTLVDSQNGKEAYNGDTTVPVGTVVQLSRRDTKNIILSYGNRHMATLEAIKPEALRLIDSLEASAGAGLCWVVSCNTRSIRVQVHLFTRQMYFLDSEPLVILVGERVEYDLPESERGNALAFLKRTFLLNDMAFALTGKAESERGFRLLGSRWFLDVEVDGGRFECARFGRIRQSPDQPVVLLQGTIEFGDGSFATRHETFLRANLAERLTRADSYLAHWEIYNDLEELGILERAAELGEVRYVSWSRRAHEELWEYSFVLSEPAPPSFRKLDLELEADESKREGTRAKSSDMEETTSPGHHWNSMPSNQAPNKSVGEIVAVSADRKRIETRCPIKSSSWKPSPTGYLIPSIRGDEVRLARQRDALEKVRAGQTPLLFLATLLEEGKAPVTRHRVYQALTEATRETLGHDPTRSQRDALYVALNTPDIAIIQGPPGTGKTSVIRALVRRLAELSENYGDNADILVTSYQHDAIENAMGGLDILGLPTHRIGGKRGVSDEERDSPLHDWVRLRQEECDRNLLHMEGSPLRQVARDVDHLIRQWKHVRGSDEGAASLLKEIVDRASPHLPPDVARQLINATEAFAQATYDASDFSSPEIPKDLVGDSLRGRLQELLAQQRLILDRFIEDGPQQARRLLRFLQGPAQAWIETPPLGLEQASTIEVDAADHDEVARVVRELQQGLNNFRERVFSTRSTSDTLHAEEDTSVALDQVLQNVSRCLRQHQKSKIDTIAEAVLSFREDLDHTEQVRDMIAKYSAVVAGTCQQIAGRKMPGNRTRYKIVIVDEAARANPPDLLIPMARGERVILVGDHKQLPHILEPDVKAAYRKKYGDEKTDRLEISLFERLYCLFETVHRQGGPRRVVTLLDDFRMHPIISQFVSDQFYREEGVSPGCRSEDRLHRLNLYGGKPVAWIDVPAVLGMETPARSKSRQIEVTVTMREVERVLKINDDPSFRVGVITFYDRQAQLLEDEWQRLPAQWKERILVGTVDAFQGLEFDVVFLSTVRSNQHEELRDRVGFLSVTNRLCVALSRAKRLLVVVGDAGTVAGSVDKPWVPALHAFYALCCSEEGYFEQHMGR